jgi:restriction system protein
MASEIPERMPLIVNDEGDAVAALIANQQAVQGYRTYYTVQSGLYSILGQEEELAFLPPLLIQAEIVVFGDRTKEGQLIKNLGDLWFRILNHLKADPTFWFKLDWRKMEELVAGAYWKQGFPKVELTPPSGDKGRDVIATWPEVGQIRVFDQVKHHRTQNNLVDANDVRALLGVLTAQGNVSKGIITTTTDFAPGVYSDYDLQRLMPHRLQLKNGRELLPWLTSLLEKT